MALKKIKNLKTKWLNPELNNLLPNQRFGNTIRNSISPQLLRYFFVKRFISDLSKLETVGSFYQEATDRGYGHLSDYIYHCQDLNIQLAIYSDCMRFNTLQDELASKLGEGWESLDTAAKPVGYFISQTNPSSAIVIRNIEEKITIVILKESIDAEVQARIFSVLYMLMPWVFDEPTEEDKSFSKLLANLETDKVATIMDEFYDSLDIRQLLIRRVLDGYENNIVENQIRNLEDKISTCLHNMREYELKVNNCADQHAEYLLNLKQLQAAVRDDSNAFANFIISHPNIVSVKRYNNDSIYYVIEDTVEFYDEDEFKSMYQNEYSYFSKSKPHSREFYELFINHRGKMIVRSEFMLRNLSSITPIRKRDSYDPESIYEEVLPHPHLAFYACLGNNQTPLRQALESGNWDMAIDQTVGATKNVNFSDSTVMNEMIRYLNNNPHLKFILADNGERMTMEQFTKYIEKTTPKGEENNGKEN